MSFVPPKPPQRLNYQSPEPRESYRRPKGQFVFLFFLGLLSGAGVSALVWFAGWDILDQRPHLGVYVMLAVPASKFLTGFTLLFFDRWRPLGAGLLVSIAVGILIFGAAFITNCKPI